MPAHADEFLAVASHWAACGPIKKMSKKIKSWTDIPESVACLIFPTVERTSEGGGGRGGGGLPALFNVNHPFTESRNNCFSWFKLSLRAQHRKF